MAMIKIGERSYNGRTSAVYLLQGTAVRDAENKPVRGAAHAAVSVAAVEKEEGTTYVTLNGWRSRADDVTAIRKQDSVLAIGALKTREYEGRTYYDLDADFVVRSGAGLGGGEDYMPPSTDRYDEILPDDDPGELPF